MDQDHLSGKGVLSKRMKRKKARKLLYAIVPISLVVLGALLHQFDWSIDHHSFLSNNIKRPFTTNNHKPTSSSSTLYIHVLQFTEGIAGWSISLAEMILLAKHLQAKVVEPCVHLGRLVSCSSSSHGDDDVDRRPLGQYLDLSPFAKYLASPEEFAEATSNSNNSMQQLDSICLHKWLFKPPPAQACQNKTNYYGLSTIPLLEDAILVSSRPTTTTAVRVLPIMSVVKHSLKELIVAGQPVASEEFVLETQMQLLQVHDTYQRRVHDILLPQLKLSPKDKFAVIHWRAEATSSSHTGNRHPNMDYVACAQQIIQAQQFWNQTTLLISPLSTHDMWQWGGVRQKLGVSKNNNNMNATATATAVNEKKNQALQLLYDNGFRKLDLVLTQVDDLLELVVMDLVLITQATQFAKCSISCAQHPCAACNYIRGKFPYLALELRANVQKSSLECWPPS